MPGDTQHTLTIRKVSPQTHARLRMRAAEHGRSVEAEVRAILEGVLEPARVDFAWRDELITIGADYGIADFAIDRPFVAPRIPDFSEI